MKKSLAVLFLAFLSLSVHAQQLTYNQLLDRIKTDLAGTTFETNIYVIQTNTIMNATQIIHPLFPAEWGYTPYWITLGVIAIFGLISVLSSFYTVRTQEVGIIERFAKFRKKSSAGLHIKVPFIDSLADTVSLMQEQHAVKFSSITKDKVIVEVYATIQYKVIPGREYDAYYLLDDASDQIETFFFDIMRAQIPVLTLDELYASKDSISNSATGELEKDMAQFGYEVQRVLITAIDPDNKVKNAMNDINAAQRESEAAKARGEASKIVMIKDAEARAESDKLRGTGLAQQRIEIAKGFQEAVELIKKSAPDVSDEGVLTMLLMTQYNETMEKIASNSQTRTILVPHSPGGASSIRQQIQEALLLSNEVQKK